MIRAMLKEVETKALELTAHNSQHQHGIDLFNRKLSTPKMKRVCSSE